MKLAGQSQIKEVDEEDLEVSAELPINLKQTEGLINRELEQLEKLISKDTDVISDFHSIDDDDESSEAFVHSKQEFRDHIYSTVEHEFIHREINLLL